jgi:hypothetical protein
MKNLLLIAFLLFTICSYGQNERPEDYDFRYFQINYKDDLVDILIKSKKGEEQKKKPLFLFCQGSLPVPLMIQYYDKGKKKIYNVFPFANSDSLSKDYHLVIVSKPYVPVIFEEKSLNTDMSYSDSTKRFPQKSI